MSTLIRSQPKGPWGRQWRSQGEASVNGVNGAGREATLVGCQVYCERRDFLGGTDPSHRLACFELFAHIFDGASLLCGERGDARLQRGRINGPRADCVASDAAADEIGSDGFGQSDDRGLARAVNVAVGDAAYRGRARRDVNDRSFASLQHARQERLNGAVYRLDVHAGGEVPIGLRAVEDGAVMDKSGTVEEDVDGPDASCEGANGVGGADIERLQFARQSFEFRGVEVSRNDAAALACKRCGSGAADTCS